MRQLIRMLAGYFALSGALAFALKPNQMIGRAAFGHLWVRFFDLTFDNAYPTGGWPLSAVTLGMGSSGTILFFDVSGGKAGTLLEYDHVNQKLKAYQNAAGAGNFAELANNSAALNGVVARCMAVGYGGGPG